MKAIVKRISLLALAYAALCCLLSTGALALAEGEADAFIDYAAQVKLNWASDTLKQEVTVKTFVDGDTTHFFVPEAIVETGVLKARYLAVNTPESTGKIEEYGKRAAQFTREKLSSASSILIESDNERWNLDSTGGRYLVWVWYKTEEMADYRNLNIELLQNGLAIANSSANNRYGDVCMAAIAQARAQKLSVYSGQRDPDFYYGAAIELTLKELRCNAAQYAGKKVAFSGVITMNDGGSVYIEDYDSETGLYYGIPVYYGYGLNGDGLDVLMVGNESRIVGTVQYYEAGGIYQVSGLTYRLMNPKDPGNIQKLSSGHQPAYVLTDAKTFLHGQVLLEEEAGSQSFDYAALALATSIEMRDLTVTEVLAAEDGDGAMTLICQAGQGESIQVRTVPLRDESGVLLTADAFLGKTLDVKGIVDVFDGTYQMKVFTLNGITVHP